MKDSEFRAWLELGDWSPKSVSHRQSVVRSLERLLPKAGLKYTNLEEAFNDDQFASLFKALRDLQSDAEGGGQDYRILMPDSEKPLNRLSNAMSFLNQYKGFLEGTPPQSATDDWPELLELKRRFLARCGDFQNFDQTSGTYYDLEREYKDRMIEAVKATAASDVSDTVAGEAVLDILTFGKGLGIDSGLPLGWQAFDKAKKSDPHQRDEYFAIIGALSRSDAPVIEAIATAGEALERLRLDGFKALTKGVILSNILCTIGCARPDQACFAKSRILNKFGEFLTGEKLIEGRTFDVSEVEVFLDIVNRIYQVMDEDWGWKPRDYFDVQGFAWAALDDRWEDEEEESASGLTVAAVRKAMAQCDELGEAEFLSNYELGHKMRYRVLDRGKSYPLKAIAMVAYKFTSYGDLKNMTGGIKSPSGAGARLKALNFTIIDTKAEEQMTAMETYPKNLILYGPPGTGKTYLSSEIAVEICDGHTPVGREEMMIRYRELVAAGRIAFTTFHQSMGYEEFVEGLRPTTDLDDSEGTSATGFRLEPRNGIFRDICSRAKQSKPKNSKADLYDFSGKKFFKMSLGRAGSEPHIFDAAFENNCVVLGYGGDVDWSDDKYKDYEKVKAKWQTIDPEASGNNGNIAQMWCFRGYMDIGDIIIISDGNHKFRAIAEVTGDYEYIPANENEGRLTGDGLYSHRRSVKWLANLDEPLPAKNISDKNFTQISCYNLKKEKLNLDAMQNLISPEGENSDDTKVPSGESFVLIIDEINRANISKVFGELITLLEPDKRLGAGPNALEVTLPYSGNKFGVPKNLFIVGTMNTADRSIALLDTALRRRFSFQEMMPLYDIEPIDRKVEGVHLGDFLKAINARIEWMFDRDHQIGHSYLTSVENLDDLEQVVRGKIIPLLTEYFYEDWEKVCMALNDKAHNFVLKEKLSPPAMESSEEESRFRYRVNPESFPVHAFLAAYEP